MAQKFQRPSSAYGGQAGLNNRSKYTEDSNASPKRPISSIKIDGDFNYLIDAVNQIDDASGSRGSVAERLDVSLNADGTLKLSVAGALDEWIILPNPGTLARIDNSTFTMAGGDFTAMFRPNRRVRILVAGVALIGDVASSSFTGGVTTVSLVDLVDPIGELGTISAAPTQVDYSPLTVGPRGNAPRRTDGLTITTGANTFALGNDLNDLAFRRNGSIIARMGAGGFSGLSAGSVSLASLASAVAEALIPTGSLAPFAGSSIPSGWLACFGQTVSRTTYAGLFAAIGTTYGVGDGSTTFGLPDLRGRSIFGRDDMGGTAASRITNAISGITGTTLGAVGGDQSMQQHNHNVTDPGHTHTVPARTPINMVGGSFNVGSNNGPLTSTTFNTGSSTTGITIANAGTGSSQNMPPAIVLNWMIKV
jgi:microcystin-dependent protein